MLAEVMRPAPAVSTVERHFGFLSIAMHYSTDHSALLPGGFGPLPMPDTRFEALWLLLCLEERRRMLPCRVGPLGPRGPLTGPPPTGSPEGTGGGPTSRCFRAADHAQQVRVGSHDPLDS